MTLSVIIVNYNVRPFLQQCLKSVNSSRGIASFEIIVIDNHSFDSSLDLITNEFPDVRIIKNSKNLGFARAVNQGLKIAKGEYICLLNPDTLIKTDSLNILCNYLINNNDVGIIGCKVLDTDGTLQLASRRKFPSPFVALPKLLGLSKLFPKSKWFGQYNQTFIDENETQEVDAVSGSCMMFPQSIINEIGNFDEQYFLYFEDTDFCYRAIKAGYKVIYNPQTQIIHYKGESLKHAPFNTIDVFHESMERFFSKHSSEFHLWGFLKILLKSAILFRKIISFIQKYKTSLVAGFFDFSSIIVAFFTAIAFWYPWHYSASVDVELFFNHWELYTTYLLFWGVATAWTSLYRKHFLSYVRSFVVSVITFLLTATITYLVSIFAYSRVILVLSALISALFISGWRILVQILFRYRRLSLNHIIPFFTRRTIIFGNDDEAHRIGELLVHSPCSDFELIGFVGNNPMININEQYPFLGLTTDLKNIIESHQINEVIFPENIVETESIIEMLQQLMKVNVTFRFVADGQHWLIGKGSVENIGGVSLVDIDFPLFDRIHLFAKRIFDIIVSSILLFFTTPIHLYFWLSKRHKKRRIWGSNGQVIDLFCYKTDVHWIRELPYLFAIFFGTMSFVGSQILDYEQKNPNILFKPGLTGLSQLRAVKVKNEMIPSFDHFYIRNHSFIFDLEILIKSMLRI